MSPAFFTKDATMPTWLYHKTNPQGVLYPDDADTTKLAAEGWVDTPAKLGELPEVSNRISITPAPAPVPTAGPGRTLASEPVAPAPWASKLFDQDGDLLEASIDQRITIIDDMGRAETITELEALGITSLDDHPVSDVHTSRLRAELAVNCHIEDVSVSRGGEEQTAGDVASGAAELSSELAMEDDEKPFENFAGTGEGEAAADDADDGPVTKAELRAILDSRDIKWGSRASLAELQALVDESNPEN